MIDAEFGGPDVGRRAAVYTAARLSHETATLIESMVRRAGARTVGKGALGNVVTRFDSVKNGRHRILESHTCELVHAYELELDPDVLGYYVQVPCDAIERTNANGRRHLSAAHIDFLVFRRTSVELIECKQMSWLQRKALDRNPDWVFEGDEWTCLPYRRWANESGIPFHVWQGPLHPAVYLSNLTVVYGALRADFSTPDTVLCRRASALLLSGPLSVAELTRNVPGFTPRTAAQMLSKRIAYGPWRSVSLSDDLGFILFSSQEQASAFDHECTERSAETFRSLDLREGLLAASAVDVRKARERLFAVEELFAGQEASDTSTQAAGENRSDGQRNWRKHPRGMPNSLQ
nr:hypothetical protein [uncultured Pseudoxanthomonas sp.]